MSGLKSAKALKAFDMAQKTASQGVGKCWRKMARDSSHMTVWECFNVFGDQTTTLHNIWQALKRSVGALPCRL
jgi:hypothetical protein